MTFGWSGQTSSVVDEGVALSMVQRFIKHNQEAGETTHYLDTARVYASGNTEVMVGAVLDKLRSSFHNDTMDSNSKIVVGTKANPAVQGGLSVTGILDQLQTSLKALQLDSVKEYFLHQPDTQQSLLTSLQCVHDLMTSQQQQQQITSLGMSNYHAIEVQRALDLCQEHQLTPPTVYQGLYNPLNRMVEEELLPLLKRNDISFVAYNPLAAGLLVGKHKHSRDNNDATITPPPGRFQNNSNYLPRFYTPANFEAMELLEVACQQEGITMVEATFRWLLRHSALRPTVDGILLGASSLAQLEENLAACHAAAVKGPLSKNLLDAFDQAWDMTKQEGVFPYWRSYSADVPNRESLDQGASYTVKK
jgi:aflatoxin B1 aldehyde reductase